MIKMLQYVYTFAVCAFIAGVSAHSVGAQDFYLADDSSILVSGSSNKSDWSVAANQFEGAFLFSEGDPQSGNLRVVVREIKSGKSLIMDRLMYAAFKEEEHSEIVFTLENAETMADSLWKMEGALEIAGVTNRIEIELTEGRTDAGLIRLSGEYDLKMSEYDMQPPRAMFGALITKDDVTIHFDLILSE